MYCFHYTSASFIKQTNSYYEQNKKDKSMGKILSLNYNNNRYYYYYINNIIFALCSESILVFLLYYVLFR